MSIGLVLALLSAVPDASEPMLILPVSGPPAAAMAFEAELARALRARLGEAAVVTHAEINAALTAERTKDLLGCDDVSCLEEILGALGGRWALAATLFEGEPLSEVVVIVRDLEDAERAFRIERRTPSLLPARLRGLCQDLVDGLMQSAGWEPTVVAGPVAASGGTVFIASEPAGARVELNGNDIGVTPLELSGLSPGDYRVRLAAYGYGARRQELEVAPGSSQSVLVKLDELRNWQGGAYGSMVLGTASSVEPTGVLTDGTLAFLDAGAMYTREVWGPVQMGGQLGYSQLYYTEEQDGALRRSVRDHGVSFGVQASVGTCLCMGTLATLVADYGTAEAAASAQRGLDDEDDKLDFALAHVRVNAKLIYRTQGVLAGELGLELGMLGVLQFDVFWAPVLLGGDFDLPNLHIDNLGGPSLGVRVILGYSAFYGGP